MYKDTPMTVSRIPLTKLHEFKDHPYKVTDNADMEALAESVSRHGILSPLLGIEYTAFTRAPEVRDHPEITPPA